MNKMFLTCIILCFFIVVDAITSASENVVYSDWDRFHYCMREKQNPQLSECVGRTALNFLQRVDEQDNFTLIDNFVAKKDEGVSTRSLVNLFDIDPVDFRGILENAGAVMGQRSLEWHMDSIYPGLMFRIGPTIEANSVAEFIIDLSNTERTLYQEEPSTARTLTKLYLLPLLLSLKFNLVALIPLVFTGICLLLKKSLILVKLMIFISSVLGVGGAGTALGNLGNFGLGGLGLPGLLRPSRPNLYGGASGFIPGKTTVYNEEHDTDDISHAYSPYKRHGRKLKFEKPRATTPQPVVITTTPKDNFYDYENIHYQLQERSKHQTTEAKSERNAYWHQNTPYVPTSYTNNDAMGWKVINLNA